MRFRLLPQTRIGRDLFSLSMISGAVFAVSGIAAIKTGLAIDSIPSLERTAAWLAISMIMLGVTLGFTFSSMIIEGRMSSFKKMKS